MSSINIDFPYSILKFLSESKDNCKTVSLHSIKLYLLMIEFVRYCLFYIEFFLQIIFGKNYTACNLSLNKVISKEIKLFIFCLTWAIYNVDIHVFNCYLWLWNCFCCVHFWSCLFSYHCKIFVIILWYVCHIILVIRFFF